MLRWCALPYLGLGPLPKVGVLGKEPLGLGTEGLGVLGELEGVLLGRELPPLSPLRQLHPAGGTFLRILEVAQGFLLQLLASAFCFLKGVLLGPCRLLLTLTVSGHGSEVVRRRR